MAEEPIRCWWKTDCTAVNVGERFAVVLTCAALEAGQTIVVPNVSQMDGGAIQLTPFEVVSSTRRADVVAAPWRYIQFEYGVRLLADGFFGQDVNIPALTVTYNFRTADGANTGRDQSYVLPALPMRVLSLVPRSATDIRDTSAMTFGDIESARFRATVARVVSWVATAFAVVLAALALLRATQRFRKREPGTERHVSELAWLGACVARLRDVRKEAASGWSPELARRALPALRLAGASALGRPVAQQRLDARRRAPRRADRGAKRLVPSQPHGALGAHHARQRGRGRVAKGSQRPGPSRAVRAWSGPRVVQRGRLRP